MKWSSLSMEMLMGGYDDGGDGTFYLASAFVLTLVDSMSK